jgi:hypothetical protein
MEYNIRSVYREMLIYHCKIKDGCSIIYNNDDNIPITFRLCVAWRADEIYIKYKINDE